MHIFTPINGYLFRLFRSATKFYCSHFVVAKKSPFLCFDAIWFCNTRATGIISYIINQFFAINQRQMSTHLTTHTIGRLVKSRNSANQPNNSWTSFKNWYGILGESRKTRQTNQSSRQAFAFFTFMSNDQKQWAAFIPWYFSPLRYQHKWINSMRMWFFSLITSGAKHFFVCIQFNTISLFRTHLQMFVWVVCKFRNANHLIRFVPFLSLYMFMWL